jgi:hypothetical protein
MTRARNLAGIVSGAFDVPADALGNVPPSDDASALTTGTLPNARLASGAAVANLGYTPVNKAGDTMTGRLTLNVSGNSETIQINTDGSFGGIAFNSGTNTTFFGHAESSGHFNVNAQAGDACVRGNNGVSISASAGSYGMRIDSSGRVLMPYQPYAKVSFNSSGYVSHGGGIIGFNYINESQGNHYNTSTYTFTCPVAGVYFVCISTIFQNVDSLSWDVKKNGSHMGRFYNVDRGKQASVLIKCAANDALTIHGSSSTLTYEGGTGDPYTFACYYLMG